MNTKNLLANPEVTTKQAPLNLAAFLPHYTWEVRYALFEGTQDEKSNELIVDVSNHSVHFNHQQSENIALESLTEEEAVKLTEQKLTGLFKKVPFHIIKKSSSTKPNGRIDWEVIFELDTDGPSAIKPRVQINCIGNQISSTTPYLYVPENWVHNFEMQAGKNLQTYTLFKSILLQIISLYIVVIAGFSFMQSKPNFTILSKIFIGLVITQTVNYVNQSPEVIHRFQTALDINNIWTIAILQGLVYVTVSSAVICILLHDNVNKQPMFKQSSKTETILMGGCLGLGIKALSLIIALNILPESLWTYGHVQILSLLSTTLTLLATAFFTLDTLLTVGTLSIHTITKSIQNKKSAFLLILAVGALLNTNALDTFINSASLDALRTIAGTIYVALFWNIWKKRPLILVSTCSTILMINQIMSLQHSPFSGYTLYLCLNLLTTATMTLAVIQLCHSHQRNEL